MALEKKYKSRTPIIIITASMELENFKKAYHNGCDDYLKKPFYLEELEIRIDKLLSNKSNKNTIVEISKDITYDTEYEELIVDKIVKRLRKKEKRLLNILLENINKTVTSEIIENYVWEGEYSNIIKPFDHYLPLKKDFSNVKEILKILDDEKDFYEACFCLGFDVGGWLGFGGAGAAFGDAVSGVAELYQSGDGGCGWFVVHSFDYHRRQAVKRICIGISFLAWIDCW